MDSPAHLPAASFREQALLARLATLGRSAGFEWLPARAELFVNLDCAHLLGCKPGAGATLATLLACFDDASKEQLQQALERLEAEAAERITLPLLRRGESAPGEVILVRDAGLEGEARITGWLRDARPGAVDGSELPEAQVDSLTGLANRRGLEVLAGDAMHLARHGGRQLALLFIDLDHFKRVNDTLGHHAGDELLRTVARRLRTCVRGSDIVARQSGDEFIIVLGDVQRPQDAALVAQKIIEALLHPIGVAGQHAHIACSIGIALFNDACPDLPALMRAADTAMYAAKESGRNTFRFYSDAYYRRLQRRQELEGELRRALEREQLFLIYQPGVRLSDGRTSGIEALLRWRGPDGEMRSPAEFMPLAEETGEIVPIGRWVLDEACRQAQLWSERGLRFERLMVNLSAQQLRDPDFAAQVGESCERHGWPPQRLELELTDAALLQDREASRHALSQLHALGVSLALDDFGTGLSNLIYLHRFQIRTLKLDRHFALGMQDDPALREVVQAVIAMAHALGLRLVAKGVESEFAADYLAARGCDEAQGYHFARPMPAADLPLWMQTRDLALKAQLR